MIKKLIDPSHPLKRRKKRSSKERVFQKKIIDIQNRRRIEGFSEKVLDNCKTVNRRTNIKQFQHRNSCAECKIKSLIQSDLAKQNINISKKQ